MAHKVHNEKINKWRNFILGTRITHQINHSNEFLFRLSRGLDNALKTQMKRTHLKDY